MYAAPVREPIGVELPVDASHVTACGDAQRGWASELAGAVGSGKSSGAVEMTRRVAGCMHWGEDRGPEGRRRRMPRIDGPSGLDEGPEA